MSEPTPAQLQAATALTEKLDAYLIDPSGQPSKAWISVEAAPVIAQALAAADQEGYERGFERRYFEGRHRCRACGRVDVIWESDPDFAARIADAEERGARWERNEIAAFVTDRAIALFRVAKRASSDSVAGLRAAEATILEELVAAIRARSSNGGAR